MDIYTAVENLGHPGSRPTEEASYRFLLLLVLTVHLFYVFVSLSFMISHFYDVTGGLSLSAVGGRATTNTDGLRQSVRSKHRHPLETPGHPIMI